MVGLDSMIQGGMGIASGIIGHKKRKAEQATAKGQYESDMANFRGLDTSNPFLNQENVYEDLTVNTQAADFTAQQQNQGMSNMMGSMNQAAGGSGIAAMAQTLANQQSQNAQQASVSIGQQEAGNQMAERQMAGSLQNQERQGELMSRDMERNQTETELGMSQNRLSAANMARQEATQAIIGGVGNIASAAIKANPAMQGMAAMDGVTSALGQSIRG
tara:strand:+ start:1236 stop:1886 length:651 start_codon:yes stop_codon:yes gene_type:complete